MLKPLAELTWHAKEAELGRRRPRLAWREAAGLAVRLGSAIVVVPAGMEAAFAAWLAGDCDDADEAAHAVFALLRKEGWGRPT